MRHIIGAIMGVMGMIGRLWIEDIRSGTVAEGRRTAATVSR